MKTSKEIKKEIKEFEEKFTLYSDLWINPKRNKEGNFDINVGAMEFIKSFLTTSLKRMSAEVEKLFRSAIEKAYKEGKTAGYKAKNLYRKKWRKERIKNGKCYQCGKKLNFHSRSFELCKKHILLKRISNKKYYLSHFKNKLKLKGKK